MNTTWAAAAAGILVVILIAVIALALWQLWRIRYLEAEERAYEALAESRWRERETWKRRAQDAEDKLDRLTPCGSQPAQAERKR